MTTRRTADHTSAAQPWAARLREAGKRGLGVEMRILGIEDPDGYTFAVGVPL